MSLSSRFTARALTIDRFIIEPEVIHTKVFKCKLFKLTLQAKKSLKIELN